MTADGNVIPRILHQTWKTLQVPNEHKASVASWRRFHPDWEYRFWTDEANRAFVAEKFPYFLPTYDAYSYPIQRADAVRYLILYHHGGVYSDLDVECLRSIGPLLKPGCFVASREPEDHVQWAGENPLCNAFMAAPPDHPFLKAVIARMLEGDPKVLDHVGVLNTTGPGLLNAVYKAYEAGDIFLLEPHVVYPFSSDAPELVSLGQHPKSAALIRKTCIEQGSYAVHYWHNGWVLNISGDLHNTDPHDIEGFDFFPGMDSPGNDVSNTGRDIPALAAKCLNDPEIVAFNTTGFTKNKLRPRWDWDKVPEYGDNEGLYVKKGVRVPLDPIGYMMHVWRGIKSRIAGR